MAATVTAAMAALSPCYLWTCYLVSWSLPLTQSTGRPSGFCGCGSVGCTVAPKWLVRGEYLFYDFGRVQQPQHQRTGIANCAVPGCGVNVTTGSNLISVLRLGVNYEL